MPRKNTGYAFGTDVPVSKTKGEIEALCTKQGATHYTTMNEPKAAVIAFNFNGNRLVFRLPLPLPDNAPDCRERWRGLLLCIKAKFDGYRRGVETFEEAFMTHVMLDTGETVGQAAAGRLAQIASLKVPMLPPPRKD